MRLPGEELHPDNMKITDVETIILSLPEKRERTDGTQDMLLVKVTTDAGIVGWGEVDSSPLVAKSIIDAPISHTISRGLRHLVIGEDPFAYEYLWHRMYQGSLYHGRRGAAIQAMSGIDLALWDIMGKALGLPVYKLSAAASATRSAPTRAPFSATTSPTRRTR
jgi:L-alanine-DL-glutamate epimerase-like enolase superfamily enzyme